MGGQGAASVPIARCVINSVARPYDGTLISHKEGRSTDTGHTWVNPQNVVLSEKGQAQKTDKHMVCDCIHVKRPEQADP